MATLKTLCEQDPYDPENSRYYIGKFVKRMNHDAAKLKLINTNFSNPHGLSDKANKSCAQDICRLTYECIKIPLVQDVVKRFKYESNCVFDWNPQRAP